MSSSPIKITGGIFLPLLAIGATLSGALAAAGGMLGLDPAYAPVILVLGITVLLISALYLVKGFLEMPLKCRPYEEMFEK